MNIYTDDYSCYLCGSAMEKADDDVLVCPNCGHSVDIVDYITEAEDYEEDSKLDDDMPDEYKTIWDGIDYEDLPGDPCDES